MKIYILLSFLLFTVFQQTHTRKHHKPSSTHKTSTQNPSPQNEKYSETMVDSFIGIIEDGYLLSSDDHNEKQKSSVMSILSYIKNIFKILIFTKRKSHSRGCHQTLQKPMLYIQLQETTNLIES